MTPRAGLRRLVAFDLKLDAGVDAFHRPPAELVESFRPLDDRLGVGYDALHAHLVYGSLPA